MKSKYPLLIGLASNFPAPAPDAAVSAGHRSRFRCVAMACSLGLLAVGNAQAAIIPSIDDAEAFPSSPAFRTFDPVTEPTTAERTLHTTRLLSQTFRLDSAITIDGISLLYARGKSEATARVRIFEVADTAATSIQADHDNAVANGFLLDFQFAMPTTPDDNTVRLLTLRLTDLDVITLPATTGTAGYAILFSVPDGMAEVFTWRSRDGNPYPDGRPYHDGLGAASGTRDWLLAISAAFVDMDQDGLEDNWEIAHGLDPNDDGSIDINNGPNGDPDGDDLNNLAEYQLGTDPKNSDTDGDGLSDGDEVSGASNAYNGASTNPLRADTDGDGVSDFEENGSLNIRFGNAPTNPNNPDTDGDGMPDGYELTSNNEGTALDPNDDGSSDPSQGPFGDRDGDSLSNIAEYDPSQGPNSFSPQTRADLADTDGDGLSDHVEDNVGVWGGLLFTGTDPTNPDSDGDGLLDGEENPDLPAFPGTGVLPTNSDPNRADTDGDSFGDKFEVDSGSDPADPFDRPEQPVGFVLVEDFEGDDMNIGQTFNGANGWTSGNAAGVMVADEPIEGADQVGRITRVPGGSFSISKSLAPLGLQILEGNTGTLFMQLYCTSANMDNSYGLSDQLSPASGNFDAYEAQAVTFAGNIIRVRDVTEFRDVSSYPTGEWMNTWIVADNAADTVKVYWESPLGESGRIDITDDGGENPFGFRIGTTDALTTVLLMVATAAEAGSSVYVDNIHVDATAENLSTPAAAKPDPGLAPRITKVEFNGSGDLLITFTPGGAGFTLTSSDDLVSPFTEEASAIYDNIDTFTVPAASLNAGQDFFRVEKP